MEAAKDFNEDTIRDMYNKVAQNYTGSILQNIRSRAIVIYTIQESLKNYNLIQDELSIMDLGCGQGRITRMLLKLMPTVKTLIGVDISPEMIKMAQNDPIQSEKLKYIASDLVDLDMEEYGNKFDLITSSFLLNHAYNEEYLMKILATVYAMLKPGGKFFSIYQCFSPNEGQGHKEISFKTGNSYTWKGNGIAQDFDPFVSTLQNLESGGVAAIMHDSYVSKEKMEECSKKIGFEKFNFKLADVLPEVKDEVSQEVWDDLIKESKYTGTVFMTKPV